MTSIVRLLRGALFGVVCFGEPFTVILVTWIETFLLSLILLKWQNEAFCSTFSWKQLNFSANLLTTFIPSLVVKAILSQPKQRELKWKANRVNDADANDN